MPETPEPAAPAGNRKMKLIAVVAVLIAFAAAWTFYLKPSGEDPAKDEPVPGAVYQVEAMQINLAGGRYLKLGIALQWVEGGVGSPDVSAAADAAIELFTGKRLDELARPEQRTKLKETLLENLDHHYHGDVLDVFYTTFVTQ